MPQVTEIVKNNIFQILAVVLALVGTYFQVKEHTAEIEAINVKIAEIEKNKVSVTSLELQRETLTHQLQELQGKIKTVEARVRRAIDDDIKPIAVNVHENDIQTQVQEARINQIESELKGLWKFTNKFLEQLNK
jgi:chromosome segregation ATPase